MSAFKRLIEGQHTPGPWEADLGVTFVAVHTARPARKTLHINTNPEKNRAEAEANARLIAAAPDMLAVLREVSAWLVCPATDTETVEQIKTVVDRVIDQASRTDEP